MPRGSAPSTPKSSTERSTAPRSLTVGAADLSSLADASLVDGAVNAVWKIFAQWSLLFRRVQTGLIQNYALMMLFGVGILVGFFYIYFW